MRVVLDTNVLVRAAADEQGLAGRLLQEIAAGPHVLVSSPYVLSEVARVLAYGRLQARWRLGEETVREFVSRVSDVAEIVLTTTPDRIVPPIRMTIQLCKRLSWAKSMSCALATLTCWTGLLWSIARATASRS
jgi:putative PIN family toxin of toxin-antitoxin system